MPRKTLLLTIALSMLIVVATHKAAAADTVSASEINRLIEIRAAGVSIRPPLYVECDENFMQKQANAMSGMFAQGKSGLAGARAGRLAGTLAACYLANPTSTDKYVKISHATLPEIAEEIGGALTMEYVGTEDPTAAAHAKVFLQFAQQNGRQVDVMMHRLTGDGADKLATDSKSALSGSAISIVAKYKQNSFAFDQQYKNKILKVSGEVSSVMGASGTARVMLLGTVTKPSSRGLGDYVTCTVQEAGSLKKIASVTTGQTATVQGIYSDNLMGQIVLSRCEVL